LLPYLHSPRPLLEQSSPEIKGQVYQRDHHRDLDQRYDHRSERDLRTRSKYRDRDRQLEANRPRGETQISRSLFLKQMKQIIL
jgi:hypothetical protein